MRRLFFLALSCVALFAFTVLGDTLHLTNGTTIQGRVIDEGDKYWVKDNDGETHLIDKSSVTSITKDSETPSSIGSLPSQSARQPAALSGSGSFANAKARADHSDTPIAGVAVWQAFIDSNPSTADLAAAKRELAHWQEMVDGNGEKINGKWIWGDARDKLLEQVRTLLTDGIEALRSDQTVVGISKLEEAVKLYPNTFEGNFELGYFNLVKGVAGHSNAKVDAGIRSLEVAVKVRPSSAAAISDLAIGYSFREKYVLSVQTAYKAVKIEDSKEIVQNLVNTIAYAPPGMRNNSDIKPIIEDTYILATKYGLSGQGTDWVWVRPDEDQPKVAAGGGGEKSAPRKGGEEDSPPADAPDGIFGEGTGFFISDSGYILTNRHVAKPGDYVMVRLVDNTLKLGQKVVIDDEQDMAVIKIKVNQPVPFVRLAAYDHPPVGADVAVFGFPLLDRFGLKSSVKMTRGIVTAWDKDNLLCDVTVDATVNPGNSGGPMVDHHGNLLALTAMKTISDSGMVTTYGLGYSTQRVRKFLKKQEAKLPGVKLDAGSDDGAVLSNEDLATRLTPCTVCVLMCKGTPPVASDNGSVALPKE